LDKLNQKPEGIGSHSIILTVWFLRAQGRMEQDEEGGEERRKGKWSNPTHHPLQ
jgi:hypothetical protein